MAGRKIPRTLDEADIAIRQLTEHRAQLAAEEGARIMRCAKHAGFDMQRLPDEVLIACFQSIVLQVAKDKTANAPSALPTKPIGKAASGLKALEGSHAG